MLDAANINIPDSVEGKSVIPLVKKEKEKNLKWRKYIHGEHTLGNQSYHCLTDGKEKYIWYSQTGEEQFFDLVEDPKELRNLINVSGYEERVHLRREQLIQELKGREEGYSDGEFLLVGKAARPTLKHALS